MNNESSFSRRDNILTGLALAGIMLLALGLRLYGLYWDGGYLFHPDERQLLLVVDSLKPTWPLNWAQLLTPESPLNPRFFAYGSLPIYLVRLLASLAGLLNPNLATLNSSFVVGRVLSALFDVGTVYLVYRLGRKLYGRGVGLLGALLVALTVLHIQLAHFFTVDTILTFFAVLTVTLAVGVVAQPRPARAVPLGIACGLALASKVSAAPLLVPIALAWLFSALAQNAENRSPRRLGAFLLGYSRAFLGMVLTGLIALATFVLCEPYALIDVVTFAIDIVTESMMARGLRDVPYTRQFIGTLPYLYPAWQMIVWSMGLPLGLAGFGAALGTVGQFIAEFSRAQWRRAGELLVPLSWVLVYFGVVGSFHAKFLRYMLPIIPFLVLWAAWGIGALLTSRARALLLCRAVGALALLLMLGGSGFYALAYMNIYRQPHTWIQATQWLCERLAPQTRIAVEHWDDPLPLLQATGDLDCHNDQQVTTLPLYSRDDTAKLALLLDAIQNNDYIILSSNRLYDTIPRLPGRYPLTSRYYQLLLGEQLGYKLVYYAAVYPEAFGLSLVDDTFSDPPLPVPALLAEREASRRALNLGRADESFTVYDHPKPLVFKRTRLMRRDELLALFGSAAENLPAPTPTPSPTPSE